MLKKRRTQAAAAADATTATTADAIRGRVHPTLSPDLGVAGGNDDTAVRELSTMGAVPLPNLGRRSDSSQRRSAMRNAMDATQRNPTPRHVETPAPAIGAAFAAAATETASEAAPVVAATAAAEAAAVDALAIKKLVAPPRPVTAEQSKLTTAIFIVLAIIGVAMVCVGSGVLMFGGRGCAPESGGVAGGDDEAASDDVDDDRIGSDLGFF